MYYALYRKYRPQIFADVVGQDTITTALSNQIETQKIAHAYMFTGTRGTGKTTCAKLFAKAVNCENRDGTDPCGKCISCLGLDNGSILDVLEIDAASNNGVDNIRDLRDETAYRPSHCTYKVYIIDEVHMLSTQAFNALLKIMEEPPSHVIFILATTEIHKVPATILSRCQRYDFLRIPAKDIAARLMFVAQQENIALNPDAADLIARLSDGAMRDALSLLDTCAGLGLEVDEAQVRRMAGVADKAYLFAFSNAAKSADTKRLLELVASLQDKSMDAKRLCEELVSHFRNFLLLDAKPDGSLLQSVSEAEQKQYMDAENIVDNVTALSAIRLLAGALDKMGRSANPRVELELALFDLSLPLPQMRAEVSQRMPIVQAPQPIQAPKLDHKPKATLASSSERPAAPSQASGDIESTPVVASELEPLAKEPTKEQEPIKAGGLPDFAAWEQVVQKMAAKDRLLYNYMKASQAFEDGRRVLISGGEMFLSYMRSYPASTDTIKAVILEVTGEVRTIGPYVGDALTQTVSNKEAEIPTETAVEKLEELQKKGLEVEYT